MQITMDKADLLKVLEKNLAAAKAEDERLKKKHQLEEQRYLHRFQANLSAALKWDYKTAKRCNFCAGVSSSRYSDDGPSCPTANAPAIASIIRQVKLAKAPSHSFSPDSDVGEAVYWQPESERAKKTICD